MLMFLIGDFICLHIYQTNVYLLQYCFSTENFYDSEKVV